VAQKQLDLLKLPPATRHSFAHVRLTGWVDGLNNHGSLIQRMIMSSRSVILLATCGLLVPIAAKPFPVEKITASVSVVRGPVNGVLIQRNGEALAIYGDPRPKPGKAQQVLFTHHRRDVVWAGRRLVEQGAEAVAPDAEKALFTDVGRFWERYRTARFHDYANQSNRILAEPVPLAKTVHGNDIIEWQGLAIRVVETPGYTRGAVSYLVEIDGKRIACVGDLIYGRGQLLDLFSLQDAIPQVQEDGYHGWAARAGDVVQSLRKVAQWKPDILIPARGPVIRDPGEAIETLVRRLHGVFASHFATDALRWYRGDDKIRAMAARVLGPIPIQWMPMAEKVQETLPAWIVPVTNSRLIVSRTGAAFLVDCGNHKVVEEVRRLKREHVIKQLDGIYITHYHDDHTDMAQAMADEFHCPVYFCREMRDILEHPEAYRMPCLTPNAIRSVHPMDDGATQRWNEFEFSYSYFPGQTIYHGGLVVKKDNGQTIFFVGDSFTPTGMDDYCLLNRNFLAPEKGFLDCLNIIKKVTGDYLLINEHVPPAFRFSSQQVDFMIETLGQQRNLLSELFPWDDPNFGVDEQWARFYPYTIEVAAGGRVELKVILRNHSSSQQEFRVTPHVAAGWKAAQGPLRVSVGPLKEGSVSIPVTVGASGLKIVTADVAFGPWDLREWTEAMVMVK
jgi:glyoxylase-like metal-dependent hydrolase (beta-lactamase superfamily II)